MNGRFLVIAALLVTTATPGMGYADNQKFSYSKFSRTGEAMFQACSETDSRNHYLVFQKDGNRVSIPGTVSVELDNWEAVYIPIDVETNWLKSTRNTRKPVLVQMTATPCTYLPFSDNAEFISLMEDTVARRAFISGLEQANGREVETVDRVQYDGRDYIGTRFKSDAGGKILFTLGSIAKSGLMVAFTFCFDQADDKAVADLEGTSIVTTFLEKVSFGSEVRWQF